MFIIFFYEDKIYLFISLDNFILRQVIKHFILNRKKIEYKSNFQAITMENPALKISKDKIIKLDEDFSAMNKHVYLYGREETEIKKKKIYFYLKNPADDSDLYFIGHYEETDLLFKDFGNILLNIIEQIKTLSTFTVDTFVFDKVINSTQDIKQNMKLKFEIQDTIQKTQVVVF